MDENEQCKECGQPRYAHPKDGPTMTWRHTGARCAGFNVPYVIVTDTPAATDKPESD